MATAAIGGWGAQWAGSETAKGQVCFEGASIPRWPRLSTGGTDFGSEPHAEEHAAIRPVDRAWSWGREWAVEHVVVATRAFKMTGRGTRQPTWPPT
ncbi:hypothetical protein MAPG_01269 [Magnaporthiopsis poae ATCC 64411]|uniref:Uncharacterized protein n=1 Tax=Magnaporthiopsis poae (strain ATCC 64411 / 73-15) TaxID=644358 RepID=A0A0C4DN89_MAGP6|nr:hypothetical protein MAPG_01269 [Magnaporthiopsis poae ATCC 64411]